MSANASAIFPGLKAFCHQARDMMAKLAVKYVGQVPLECLVELCVRLYLKNLKGQQSNSYLRVIKICQNRTQFDTNECQRKSKWNSLIHPTSDSIQRAGSRLKDYFPGEQDITMFRCCKAKVVCIILLTRGRFPSIFFYFISNGLLQMLKTWWILCFLGQKVEFELGGKHFNRKCHLKTKAF